MPASLLKTVRQHQKAAAQILRGHIAHCPGGGARAGRVKTGSSFGGHQDTFCVMWGAAGEDTQQHHGNSLASRRDWQELESGRSMEEQVLAAAAPPAPAAIRAWGAPRRLL